LVAPFFGDFVFRYFLPDKARIEWTERGNIDTPYSAHALSDGTLRFICLATLLLQPIELLPDTVLIDEPELGLHPYAINILANMIKRVAEEKQLIISTQSVELLNEFEPADVIVVEREPNVSNLPPYSVPFVPGLAQEEYGSIFKRLDTEQLKNWLEDYALGELWKSNVLGGGPLR
jgi:energy-coupling factor transporter ATP-binding protein EcfA2